MKIKRIILFSVFITLMFTGCDSESPSVSDTNRLNSYTSEAFILRLVNCDDAYISRYYESYEGHKGIDVAAPEGKEIYAAADGVVSRAVTMNLGYGTHCIIDHGEYRTLYAHCSELLVNEGDEVKQGDAIALVGNTGNSTGAHLHFEVINAENQARINPLDKF